MKLSRQEYWSGLSFPSPGDLLDPGIKATSLHWRVDSLLLHHLEPMLNAPYGTISQVTSHLPGSRLVTLNYSHQGRASVLSLLKQTLTLDADLHCLHSVLLPKLPSGDLENALFTIMIFHTILLHIKEIISQQRNHFTAKEVHGNGPRLMEFTTLA